MFNSIFNKRLQTKILNCKPIFYQKKYTTMSGIKLSDVVSVLNEFANEKLAQKWDNVGLLIEPYTPRLVQKIFLTNDLTEPVMLEAVEKNIDLIISYHPPIFSPLKRVTQTTWKERIVTICLENRIALYSPHTSWDSVRGGSTDWLIKALPISESKPITEDLTNSDYGSGRIAKLSQTITLRKAVDLIKTHIGLNDLQVSVANNGSFDSEINSVAACTGSGASVLKGVEANLYLTGEMSHHEVLDVVHNGSHVILCNHSNSERGFLKEFKQSFGNLLNNKNIEILISEKDADPLKNY